MFESLKTYLRRSEGGWSVRCIPLERMEEEGPASEEEDGLVFPVINIGPEIGISNIAYLCKTRSKPRRPPSWRWGEG